MILRLGSAHIQQLRPLHPKLIRQRVGEFPGTGETVHAAPALQKDGFNTQHLAPKEKWQSNLGASAEDHLRALPQEEAQSPPKSAQENQWALADIRAKIGWRNPAQFFVTRAEMRDEEYLTAFWKASNTCKVSVRCPPWVHTNAIFNVRNPPMFMYKSSIG